MIYSRTWINDFANICGGREFSIFSLGHIIEYELYDDFRIKDFVYEIIDR